MNFDFQSRLTSLSPLWTRAAWKVRHETWFDEREIERLDAACRRGDPATSVYCVYENPFARSGGIFAVADHHSRALVAAGRPCLVLSPLHRRLSTAPALGALESLEPCEVPWAGGSVPCSVQLCEREGVCWVLFGAAGFFESEGGAAHTDPYAQTNPKRLLEDSLFACAAVPRVLAKLVELGRAARRGHVLHVQDWEFASVALTAKQAILDGVLEGAVVALTLHNAYDQTLPVAELQKVTPRRPRQRPGAAAATTVLEHMLPLADTPITTVSRQFASELTRDPLQAEVYADHLQSALWQCGVIGVDNGAFGRPGCAFSATALRAAEQGNVAPILDEKRAKASILRRILADYEDPRMIGRLALDDGEQTPTLLAFGRLDPNQKGFDVLARAIERLERGSMRFVLTPIASDTSSPFFRDLEELARARDGEIVIFPYFLQRGYAEAMAGAAFAVMPSLYEPFGAATEPYLAGTPVVARATGGLAQQVTDVIDDPERGTGLLYREPASPDAGDDFRRIVSSDPSGRRLVPTYRHMVEALAERLERAADICRNQPGTYGRMLARLHRKAAEFSWARNIEEYAAVQSVAPVL